MSDFVIYVNPDRASAKIHKTSCKRAKNHTTAKGWFGPINLTKAREICKGLQPNNKYPFCSFCGIGILKGEPDFNQIQSIESSPSRKDCDKQ